MEESDSGQQPKRCPCGFWGSTQTSGLCSKCYKATVQEKTQDGLDAKSELLRNRQSTYADGATSSTFLSATCGQAPNTTMEKAEEFLRQAVKNSGVENTDNSVASDKTKSSLSCISKTENKPEKSECNSDNDNGKDKNSGIAPSTSDIGAASSNEKKDIVGNDSKTCDSESKTDATQDLASPEKRGVKRDISAVDDTTPNSTPEKPGTKSKKRCAVCKCKLELAQRTIGKCRCDNVYCSLHRLPELHNCDFDHKEDGRREARGKMVKPTRHLGTSFKRLDSDS